MIDQPISLQAFIDNLYTGLLIGLFPALIYGIVTHVRILSKIKHKHPALWAELGKPTFFSHNAINKNRTVQKFIRDQKYMKVNDERLRVLCEFQRKFIKFYMAGFSVWLLLFIFKLLESYFAS